MSTRRARRKATTGSREPPVHRTTRASLETLRDRLLTVHQRMVEAETHVPLEGFGESRDSARNLLHYLALRGFDLREVQDQLADLGLSSLGRAEGHVLYNLETVLERLSEIGPRRAAQGYPRSDITPGRGRKLLDRNARRLLGPSPERATRIMVTLPTDAANDPEFLPDLLRAGTDVVRINCAHDSEVEWSRMAQNLRRARRQVGRACHLEMDLGGPRLRTGPLEAGPAVLRVRPARDAFGRSLGPGTLRLVPPSSPRVGFPDTLAVPGEWLRRRRARERLTLRDARGATRVLRVVSIEGDGVLVAAEKSTYLTNGVSLRGRSRQGRVDPLVLRGIAARAGRIRLSSGDWLRVTANSTPGWDRDPRRRGTRAMATIGVSHPDLLARIRIGDQIWFDGGRIGGVARRRSGSGFLVEIQHAPPEGTWLRSDQGINLPDTDLGLPSLLDEDRALLPFVVRHADLVGYSFVESADGIARLRGELVALGRPKMGIVLKIETRRAFERLPEILLGALQHGPAAVMVARGDLAVEVGFERLSEVQEEILWLSEAAHLPAIWATQVLEGLAKSGMPTRAEVTDAAMGERAECVMLNKGPYLIEAVRALDGIVRRMQAHQAKKSARLRLLHVAERFLSGASVGDPPANPVIPAGGGR